MRSHAPAVSANKVKLSGFNVRREADRSLIWGGSGDAREEQEGGGGEREWGAVEKKAAGEWGA